MFTLYGNRGEYRMPYTPQFDTRQAAVDYGRTWHGYQVERGYVIVGCV